MCDYSVIIPVYNEEKSLPPLFEEITGVMADLQKPYEVIFVNDGSADRSPAILEEFQKQRPDIVRVIDLKRRQGQTFALRQGLNAVKGRVGITLDADLQNDPADIPKMIAKMQEGYDVVCGWRKTRQDKPLKAVLSKLGNTLQRIFTGLTIHDISCTLRAYKQDCLGKVALNWEGQHRFMPLSLSLQGYQVGEVVSNHRQRKFGESKYSHRRVFKVVLDFFRVLVSRGRA